jgi:trigger factor
VNITVNDLNSVDKEVVISATRDDLANAFDKALRKYRTQMNIPGFRPGKAPLDVVKKRYGKDIELDEVRNYVLDIYNDMILDKYKPVGESIFKKIDWKDDKLDAVILIGLSPVFEMSDLSELELDKLIYDATDEDAAKEIDYLLEKEGSWSAVEQAATESNKVIVDVFGKDHDGNLKDGDVDPDQEMDLRDTKFADYKPFLLGKVAGDEVDAEIKHGDHSHLYKLVVKEVQTLVKPELTEDLIEKFSNGQYKTEEEYKAFLKSRVQEYFDQTADTMLKNQLVDVLVEKHAVEVPQTLLDMLIKRYVDDLKKKNNIEQEISIEPYRASFTPKAIKEARWYYISEKLQEKYGDDISVTEADINAHFEKQAAQMGFPADFLKSYYESQPEQLDSVKQQLHQEKVYDKCLEIVKITELSKDAYEEKHLKKSN